MNRLKIDKEWWNEVVPQGLPYPSSTLISGPGGSGKPLIGFAFVHDWLRAGGNVVFVPLQYPDMVFVKKTLKDLYDMDLEGYEENTSYVQFDPEIEGHEKVGQNEWRANLLMPDIWDEMIDEAEYSMADGGELGTLVFASALNILLFSPTYRELTVDNIERLLRDKRGRSFLFNVSTSAFREAVRDWEEAADNLMFSRMGDDMKLYLTVDRLANEEVALDEVYVPIEREMLQEIKDVAETVRKRRIPQLKEI